MPQRSNNVIIGVLLGHKKISVHIIMFSVHFNM